MAYKSCAAKLAANIAQDCNKPLVGGYTGRAVILSVLDFERADVVRSADNPRKILSVVLPPNGSVMAYTIDNVFAQPFTGSTTAGNNENGRNGYLKTLSVRVPMRGADVSKDVIEPLVKDPNGFVVIAEKRDKVGDGSYEIIGYQNALRGDIAGVTRDENANGGDWIVPLTTVEKWAEVTLVGAAETYESAKKEFEGLLGFEPMVMRMHTSVENQGFFELIGSGQILIDIIKNGAPARISLIDPNYDESKGNCCLELNNDADTDIVIWGEVTSLNAGDDMDTGLTSFTSDNNALTHLILNGNEELTSLDVSKSTALTELKCDGTGLTSLDVSKNTALTKLRCNGTELTSLDVSKNIALTELDCSSCTELTSLDVSKNIALTELDCSDCTSFTSLDVSNNTSLIKLLCIDCSNLMLLDIQNTAQLAELNFFIGGFSVLTNLTTLQVAGTSAHAYDHVESWLNGNAPDGGMIYVDENTPQAVITAAEAKDWEVIYQS